jgi:hypothetical protein
LFPPPFVSFLLGLYLSLLPGSSALISVGNLGRQDKEDGSSGPIDSDTWTPAWGVGLLTGQLIHPKALPRTMEGNMFRP